MNHSTRSARRRIIECSSLEARRLLCSDHDPAGISTIPTIDDPAAQGSPSLHVESSFNVDTLIVPAYSSRPSASRKIFLDFNGHNSVDNWGGWWEFGGKDVSKTPAYDLDGNPDAWTNQELANIQLIWKGVAEKFSPFDVDVTTVKPSTVNGVQVVIGGDGAWNGGGGGVGIVGGWGEEGFTDANSGNVAWVWDGQNNPTYVVEAVSHEAGHTLGLYHVSKQPFETNEYVPGWIMGAGDGGIGRWTNTALSGTTATTRDDDDIVSKGNQDELATIVSGHGFTYRADDYGNTTGAATLLTETYLDGAHQANAAGVIEQSSDIDMFRFSHPGGTLDVEVKNAEFRGMLDPQLVLRNSAGTIIASSNTNTGGGVGEILSFNNIDPGTYYVSVGGSGTYGDIGQFRLNIRSGQATSTANDTLTTATPLGVFGDTDASSVALGFGGTAIINDSFTTVDQYDYFKLLAPANTKQLYVQISGLTTTASIAIYDDLNGNGIVETGEIASATNPSTSFQSLNYTNAVGGKYYYVRAARGSSAGPGNYQLRITADAAPASLPATVTQAAFDPAPLRGGKAVYESLDSGAADNVDYFRVKAEAAGLLTFYMSFATADLRLDVGPDTNGNGTLDAGEITASAATASFSEYLQNVPIAAGQQMLVRVMPQAGTVVSNYSLFAIADYATGGNTTGVLTGARDLSSQMAGTIYEYLDSSVDFYDTFRITPNIGTMQAKFVELDPGAAHRLDIIRDGNNNGTVESGEVVASGFANQLLSYNVIAGGTYYLRVAATSSGEFFSTGNYKMTYVTAGSVTGWTFGSPGNISITSTLSALAGYLSYDPTDPTLTNPEDYYRFTLSSRTRLDLSINGGGMGLQVGQASADGTSFVRIAGVGTNDGTDAALNVNLDPGTYLIRAYLAVPERQEDPIGGNYGLTFKTSAITDNSPPVVTSAAFQYEVKPNGVSFNIDQDVAGSVDPSDVIIKNLATNVTYPIGQTYYDSTTHRIGYAFAAGVLPDGNYRATLQAGSLRDTSANLNTSAYTYDFFVLAGDANRDRKVDIVDLGTIATNWQGTGRTFSQGDFNYDGHVDIVDLGILASSWQKTLPASLVAGAVGSEDSANGVPVQPVPQSAPSNLFSTGGRRLFDELESSPTV